MTDQRGPLWMPYGSVRAVLALALVGVTCAGFLIGKIPSDAFVPLVVAVTSFYFGTKAAQTQP